MFFRQDKNLLSFINWQWQVAKDKEVDEPKQHSSTDDSTKQHLRRIFLITFKSVIADIIFRIR